MSFRFFYGEFRPIRLDSEIKKTVTIYVVNENGYTNPGGYWLAIICTNVNYVQICGKCITYCGFYLYICI